MATPVKPVGTLVWVVGKSPMVEPLVIVKVSAKVLRQSFRRLRGRIATTSKPQLSAHLDTSVLHVNDAGKVMEM